MYHWGGGMHLLPKEFSFKYIGGSGFDVETAYRIWHTGHSAGVEMDIGDSVEKIVIPPLRILQRSDFFDKVARDHFAKYKVVCSRIDHEAVQRGHVIEDGALVPSEETVLAFLTDGILVLPEPKKRARGRMKVNSMANLVSRSGGSRKRKAKDDDDDDDDDDAMEDV
jgi:hypothetical protein